jgi:hypothetical protein
MFGMAAAVRHAESVTDLIGAAPVPHDDCHFAGNDHQARIEIVRMLWVYRTGLHRILYNLIAVALQFCPSNAVRSIVGFLLQALAAAG